MIRIFPDFSVQVTAAAAGGAAGGVPAGPGMGRASTAANGNPQNVQGITSYQQREGKSAKLQLSGVVAPAAEALLSLLTHKSESSRSWGSSWAMPRNTFPAVKPGEP
uniref:Uncharacterized protein n=1 Tax=Sphaerodactylus townsendi TaxID=933632 RepID=A0ACB8G4E4_9SAUR